MSDQEDYDLASWHQYEQDLQQELDEVKRMWKELDELAARRDKAYLDYVRRIL